MGDSSNRPRVLLHGFTGSPASFESSLPGLEADVTVVAPTLPGHLEVPAPVDLNDALSRLRTSIEDAGPPVHIVGYSLGGRLGMHYTLRFPEHVCSATFLGSRPGLPDSTARADRRRTDSGLAELLQNGGLEPFLARWEQLPLLRPRTSDLTAIAESQRIRRLHSASSLAKTLETLSVGALPDLWTQLARIEAPCRWVAGAFDTEYRALMAKAAELTPNGEFVEIREAGHAILVDAPTAVASLIQRPQGAAMRPR